MKVAVVGATGMVGNVMLEVLREQNFPITELIPVASEKSVGNKIHFGGLEFTVVGLETAVSMKPDVAIFSAGGETSLEWAPKFAAVGTFVIDNSSAWRMDPDKKLIVPEINGDSLTENDKIIANPNCSTIQLVLALSPLHKAYGIKRVVVSTYQSITGTGVKAVQQMENERVGKQGEMAYHYPIDKNCIPQCDVFIENGYTKEEMKLTNETKKILVIGCSLLCLGTVGFYLHLFFFSKKIHKARSKYYNKQVNAAAYTIQAYIPYEVWTSFLLKCDQSDIETPV